MHTRPVAKAPDIGEAAMMNATVRFFMAVMRLRMGVYARVAAAERAMMSRSMVS